MLGASLGETEGLLGHIYIYTVILCNNILLTVNKCTLLYLETAVSGSYWCIS